MALFSRTTESGDVLEEQGLPRALTSDEARELAATVETSSEADENGNPLDETLNFRLPGVDNRERALPVRQGDLTRLLLAEPGLTAEERGKLNQFGRLLGELFHSEFYDKLRELKELYAPLDPDSDYVEIENHSRPLTATSDETFLEPFEVALLRANYRSLDLKVIEQAITAPNETGLTYVPDFSLFEHMKVYVRGFTRVTRECRTVKTRFFKRLATFDAYQRMVVVLKFKEGMKLGPLVRSDVLYLRMFKDVPHVDMEMHLPEQGTRVKMRWIDKAQIASPLVMGIPTLLAKVLLATFISPLALGGLMVAPITAGVNSFFGFQRAKQKHLYEMIYRLYYLTLANNSSVLTRAIDSAEDEEYKEAMLAYFFLWRGNGEGRPWEPSRPDQHIEHYLMEKTGVEINFEVSDALGKLFTLGLAKSDSKGFLKAVSLDDALLVLNQR